MTEIIPQFIQGGAGQVFTLYFPSVTTPRGAVLYLPPLTEEMNRCRSLVSTQARNLARLGYAVLLLDYYGTGDSAGELKDASWSVWHEDITAASLWLAQKTELSITLWGCRLGALLAAEAAGRAPDLYKKLLFWQPVIDGKLYLTQFLRLRVAALMDRGLPAETTDSMRAQFAGGHGVAVSGYELSPSLAQPIDATRLSELHLPHVEIDWMENVSEPDKPLTPGSLKVIEALRATGTKIQVHPFTAPPVWQLHEREEAPDLMHKTTQLFESQA